MRFLRSFLVLALAQASLATLAGCTLLVDGTLAGRTDVDAAVPDQDAFVPDAGTSDAGPPVGACTGMPDGLRCMPDGIIEPFLCIDQICVLSRCGDGEPDERMGSMHDPEACDDGNDVENDGCESDCTYSCMHDADCDDGNVCTGIENCDSASHVCMPGTNAPLGTACTLDGSTDPTTCHDGVCRAGECPDGHLDDGEECDPAATPVAGDGCEDDCTFTCEDDGECQDADLCTIETCNVATHTCAPAAAPRSCDDGDACTNDSCAAETGCVNTSVLVDADSDGHSAITATCGGDDCNDGNAAAYPGATEACGATSDLNCDGSTGVTPTYYRDCDGDGFAASTSGSVMSCTTPAAISGCSAWVTRAPSGITTTDCLDTFGVGASARPGQSSYYTSNAGTLSPAFDFDCDRTVERQYPTSTAYNVAPDRSTTLCLSTRGSCGGDIWWVAAHATPPACGTMATQSYCGFNLITGACGRSSRTTQTVACH